VQKINKPGEIEFKIEYFDTGSRVGARCTVPGEIADLRHITDLIQAFIKPFDLALAPLFRVGLVKIDDETNLLIVDMHHIISDGASVEILAREFSLLYAGKELPYLGLRCRDYSEWWNSGVLHEIMKQQEPFWLAELAGETPALHLPYDYPKPAVRCFTGGRFTFAIKKENVRVLKARAADASTTLFTVLLAVYNVFLSKICGQEDMVVGTITEGRGRPGLESIIGMFVNALPLRNFPAGEICFNRFLGEVKQRALAALSHRDYPYEDLVEKTGVTFSTVFALLDLRFAEIEIPGLRLAPYDYFTGTAKYDLLLLAAEGKEDLNFIFEYSTACFRAETVRRFSGYFARVVSAVAEHQQVKLSEIEILSGEEKQQILCEFNETGRGYPTDKTICRLFADQVRLTPDGIALVDTGRENLEGTLFLSYRQLAEESGRLASFLVRRGVKANGLIGILVERGRFMLTGILGILISGCGYVPLNPKAPLSRNRYILKECGVKILLTTGSLKEEVEKLASSGVETVFIDEMDCRVGAQDSVPEPTPPFGHLHASPRKGNSYGAAGIAYVIFTSGSTGRPKGIAVSHANFCPLLFWGYEELGISPGERTIQNLSYYFDWSVWEIFITLTTGATLYLVPDDVLLEPGRCIDFINLHGITILHITPTRYQYIVGRGGKPETLKYLCLGAEKLSFDLLERSITSVNEDCRVFNMYGPTEATIMSAVLEIKRHDYARYRDLGSVPIGRPIANFQLLILDKNLHLCPLNVPGELGIAGSGLARGYLNRPELTNKNFIVFASGGQLFEKSWTKTFVNNKSFLGEFSTNYGGKLGQTHCVLNIPKGAILQKSPMVAEGNKIYKTGDLTRWLPDGEIEFLGRIDQQVKLRGFRIELGEIEKHLLAHPGVKEAVVRIREDDKFGKDKYLCAYLIAGRKIDPAELREFLSAALPSYMIPSYFVTLDRMPLTPNGKIDHKALPEPDRAAVNDEYSAPRDEVEKRLAALWTEALGVEKDKIDINSDFFEYGGHSLKAADLTYGLHKEFGVRLPLVEVFKNPTIKELAKVIKRISGKTFASIEAVEKKEYYLLSSVQKRMYVIRLLQKESTAYNISNVVIISGEIDSEILEKTFRQLIGRHESFRTSFFTVGDSPVQRIYSPAEIEFKIEYFEIGRGEPCVRPSLCSPETIALIIDRFIRPFDPAKAPLLRAGLVKIEKNRHLLMVDMHHIISDGLSHEILAADFAALYIGKELPPLRIQYRDFSEGQGRLTRPGEMAKQERFWLDMFPDEHVPVLDIPVDFPRPAVRDTGAGDYIKIELEKTLCNKCYKIVEETGATLFMVTLAAYNILLSIYTNREDIVVGTLLTGRSHPDLKNIIGMFVTTLPLRNFPGRNKTFRQFLAEVKENLLAVYENQDYSFDDLIVKLRLQGDSSRNPLFDTLFTMNTLTVGLYDGPTAFRLEPYEYEAKFAKFDLYFLVTESKGTISLLLRYSTQLFKPAAVRKMASYFNEILDQVTDDPGIRLKDITLSHDLLSVKSTVQIEDGEDFKFD
jgi:amino acid adenylation domain-containing protein